MILRRFTKHITEQNWFAVTLDVLVVIVGIYLGLQVTNWQEDLKDDVTSRQYLQRLNDDLASDVRIMKLRVDFWRNVSRYINHALTYAEQVDHHEAKKTEDYWPYLLAFFHGSQVSPFEVTNITYNELQQAGQLALIRKQSLRTQLAVYYSFNEGIAASALLRHTPPYRNYIRGKIPSKITKYIWKHCFKVSDFEDQQLLDCDSPITNEEVKILLDEIMLDKLVLQYLRSWGSTQTSANQLIVSNMLSANLIMQLVQSEIHE